METHKCKLCSTLFTNARALGNHMKAHTTPAAAAPPLPPSSSFSAAAADDLNSDPIFNIDRESETESKNPTHKRSKRRRKPPPEPPERTSSVSDTSPEEDLAMCLMMLSRDRQIESKNEIPNRRLKKKKCEKCTKQFRSYRALFSHEKICQLKTEQEDESLLRRRRRIFKCPFCLKVFGSGQALGGHKRSHLVSSINGGVTVNGSVSSKMDINLIDLNLPAPLDHDHHDFDYGVVYDA